MVKSWAQESAVSLLQAIIDLIDESPLDRPCLYEIALVGSFFHTAEMIFHLYSHWPSQIGPIWIEIEEHAGLRLFGMLMCLERVLGAAIDFVAELPVNETTRKWCSALDRDPISLACVRF